MFAYCINNPVCNSDPSGSLPISMILVFGLGFVAGALLAPTSADVKRSAENHYSRNKKNKTTLSIDEIMNSYDKQAEWADEYHENTNGTQGEDAAYNDKYLSPNGGHIEVIICSPPNSEPYIVDETVDALNMGTYNLASNEIPVVYHIDHFFRDMVPYYLYGNTSGDDVGWLKWVID